MRIVMWKSRKSKRYGLQNNGHKNTLLITGVFVSTIIGAGFASGREIVEFFLSGGYRGIYGVILSVALFLIVGAIVLKCIYKYNVKSCDELLNLIFPTGYIWLFNFIVLGAMISIYIVMISGVGATLCQQLGISRFYGSLFVSLVCLMVFYFGDDGLVYSMNFMAPLVVAGAFLVCMVSLSGYIGVFADNNVKYLFVNPILYVSYNIITLLGVMPGLRKYITSNKVAVYSSAFSACILGILAILISACILFFQAQAKEIPMLYVAVTSGRIYNIIYFLILIMAMFTTAISNGYGSIGVICSSLHVKNRLACVFIFVTLCLTVSLMSFSSLVKYLYRILGYIGIVELFFILYFPIKAIKRRR